MKARVVVIGGGAAGFFAAITAAESEARPEVVILEKSGTFLSKVRVSGGGRCNVTHACFNPRELSRFYPRGGRALIGSFNRFQPQDTIAWFESRGVPIKKEADGRMFPTSNDSGSVVDGLITSAKNAGVQLRTGVEVVGLRKEPDGSFVLDLSGGETLLADRVLIATGGSRVGGLAEKTGHAVEAPIPSLFTFRIEDARLKDLAGVAVKEAVISGLNRKLRGPVLITHWGMSGPAVLRFSAWEARALSDCLYQFELSVNWIPEWSEDKVRAVFQEQRVKHPGRQIRTTPLFGVPLRLWEKWVDAAEVPTETRWSIFKRDSANALIEGLLRTRFKVSGKSMNKEEFVTCGGVRLSDVDFKTMESRRCPGLFFAGEVLDIDGLTGGFNFQAAWTTGWIAGQSLGKPLA